MIKIWVFGFLLVLIFQRGFGIEQKISLNSENYLTWSFYATQNTSLKGYANVPGDIYTDLWKSNLIDDPLKGSNDVAYAWVGRTDWSYSRSFDVPSDALKASQIRLNFAGLDTIASVYINNIFVLGSKNQFIDCSIDLKGRLKPSGNILRIDFTSPVTYAQKQSDNYKARYGHIVPPDFPLPIQNGEPHPQFIRKAQASFSWDWGPSFPTMGIWKNVWISYSADTILLKQMSPLITHQPSKFIVQIDVEIFCTSGNPLAFTLLSSLPELSLKQSKDFRLNCDKSGISKVSHNLTVPEASIELWWPNGYGNQKLYTLQTNILSTSSKVLSSSQKKIGFRYVELIQDLVDSSKPDKGRHFYFKVNSVPIFLKGSNFIEVSDFPGRNSSFRTKFLLKSSKEANLNALRVWGGGIFEGDEFYSLADEYGILLWHDMLFACSLYPVDSDYLSNVYAETTVQVQRLRYHPSILVWAGNNENELAIQSGWWYVPNYSMQDVIADYVKLYRDTIGPVVKSLDPSRPYLLSSPSNGIVSEQAGGVGSNPNSETYGDIHFYNEYINLWKDGSYQIPRCATEFGVQSIPMKDTLLSYINESEYYYSSKSFTDRQHHTGGIATLLTMTFNHFDTPKECSDQNGGVQNCPFVKENGTFLAPFSYLTQLHQSLSMQVQSEHYRRWRGNLNSEGKGNTMCALYWQLNDVWAAPSWASIDYNLEWKAIHYFAKKFFAPIIVSLYLDGNGLLQAYIVSDKTSAISGVELKIEMLAWKNGFTPVYTQKQNITVAALTSTSIKIDTQFATSLSASSSDFIIRGTLMTQNGKHLTPPAILHPDKFWNLKNFGNVSISNFKKIDSKTYQFDVIASAIAPFVWIDLNPTFKQKNPFVGFRFSDNAFTATNPTTTVQLMFEIEPSVLTSDDIVVCQLETCFRTNMGKQ